LILVIRQKEVPKIRSSCPKQERAPSQVDSSLIFSEPTTEKSGYQSRVRTLGVIPGSPVPSHSVAALELGAPMWILTGAAQLPGIVATCESNWGLLNIPVFPLQRRNGAPALPRPQPWTLLNSSLPVPTPAPWPPSPLDLDAPQPVPASSPFQKPPSPVPRHPSPRAQP
jgi:hypothetical protein